MSLFVTEKTEVDVRGQRRTRVNCAKNPLGFLPILVSHSKAMKVAKNGVGEYKPIFVQEMLAMFYCRWSANRGRWTDIGGM